MIDRTHLVLRIMPLVAAIGGLTLIAGCQHHITVDPIRVEPIHLTLDVTLKVDRELDRFFDYEDPGPPPADTTAPAPLAPGGDRS